jgi:hypothetical protein
LLKGFMITKGARGPLRAAPSDLLVKFLAQPLDMLRTFASALARR